MTRRRTIVACVAALPLLLLSVLVAYPFYPSPRTLCGVMEERAKIEDRDANPHRGAVLLLNGELYGFPLAGGHPYAFRTRCKGYEYFVPIDTSAMTLSSAETRRTLHKLISDKWPTEERHAPFTIAARVTSEVQGCFSPPMVLTAVAMQSRSDVKVEKRTRPVGR